jgi:hypothetical protein
VEAVAVLLMPQMLGARDLPFPRSSPTPTGLRCRRHGFFSSLFFGLAPDGGWFMYTPLTSKEYSPGINTDFWLLGIGFIEISAIAGAIEMIVGILRTRAPGMSLDKLPVFAWAMLVFAGMVVFAFPAVISPRPAGAGARLRLAVLRLPRGGDPLLWQHLFWFFGHPEVYVIFLPAAGMVSMICRPWRARRSSAYSWWCWRWSAPGSSASGCGCTTCSPPASRRCRWPSSPPPASRSRCPSGIQVFAWIATFAAGRCMAHVPTLFVLGFFFIFVLGGLTGVMVAVTCLRLAGARHLLHRRAPALRADRRHGLPAARRASTTGRRLGTGRMSGAARGARLLAAVHRHQPHLLPDAHHGPASACRGGSTPIPTIAAIATTVCFVALTFKANLVGLAAGLLTIALFYVWAWRTDAPVGERIDIGGGVVLPAYVSGPRSVGYSAVVVGLVFDAVAYGALLFSYLYLFTVRGTPWPPMGYAPLDAGMALWPAGLFAAAVPAGAWTLRMLRGDRLLLAGAGTLLMSGLHATGIVALLASMSDTSATRDAYGATVWTIAGYGIAHAVVLLLMALYVIAALLAGRLGARRPLALENTVLVSHYTSAVVLVGIALVALFPRMIGHG